MEYEVSQKTSSLIGQLLIIGDDATKKNKNKKILKKKSQI
jgi:hypothetical protein